MESLSWPQDHRPGVKNVDVFDPVSAVGRTDENDISIPDISISRHHARLHRQDDGSYVLQDLGSSNGTHVHGRRVNRPVRVVTGDRIHFGNIECLSVTCGWCFATTKR